jgi:hypothetical protein
VKHRLIHWQTTSGLDNQGSVEFWPEGANYSHSQEVGVRMNLIIRLPKPLAYMTRSDGEDGKRIKVMVHKILSSDLVRFKRLMEESASPGTATARISNPQDESYHQAPKASGIHDTQRWRRLETHLRSAVGLAHGGGGGQCCIGLLTVHASVSVRCLVHLPSVKECIFSMSLYLCDLRRFERILLDLGRTFGARKNYQRLVCDILMDRCPSSRKPDSWQRGPWAISDRMSSGQRAWHRQFPNGVLFNYSTL